MPVSLDRAIEQCIGARPLPDGYRIEADRKTDNLMVCGPTLCFCVTRKAIEEGRIPAQFPAALNALLEAELRGGAEVILPRLA